MTLDQIKKIIAQGESSTVELKRSTAQLRAAFETACAFLNGDGGIIMIGVTDQGKIIGQEVSDKTRQEIANVISEIEPPAQSHIAVSYVPVDGKNQLIIIKVEIGNHIPYTFDSRPFHRIQSTNSRMPQHRYEQLIVQRGQLDYTWESALVPECSIDDLDEILIRNTINEAIKKGRVAEDVSSDDIEGFLYSFRLLQSGTLNRAARLLFCRDEQKQFVQSQLRLARFRGIGKDEFIDNKTYVGNIFYLYDKAMTFFHNYLPISGKINEENPTRVDTPAIPNKVLREVLVNALCHRDYSIVGGAISVAIYDDRVEVSSTGRLPSGINMANLIAKHRSTPRNPIIASVLYAVGYIEKWGRGIEKIISLSKEVGNPEPYFEETEVDVNVCLPLRKPILSGADATSKSDISLRQDEILAIIEKYKTVSTQQILSELKKPVPKRTIQADLTKLKRLGLVESKGRGKATVWIISASSKKFNSFLEK